VIGKLLGEMWGPDQEHEGKDMPNPNPGTGRCTSNAGSTEVSTFLKPGRWKKHFASAAAVLAIVFCRVFATDAVGVAAPESGTKGKSFTVDATLGTGLVYFLDSHLGATYREHFWAELSLSYAYFVTEIGSSFGYQALNPDAGAVRLGCGPVYMAGRWEFRRAGKPVGIRLSARGIRHLSPRVGYAATASISVFHEMLVPSFAVGALYRLR